MTEAEYLEIRAFVALQHMTAIWDHVLCSQVPWITSLQAQHISMSLSLLVAQGYAAIVLEAETEVTDA